MFKDKIDSRFIVLVAIVLFAAISRLMTQGMIPNFSPIGAIALFSGAYFKDKKLAFLVPVLSMLLSDLFIEFHATMLFVYAGFILTVAIGFMLRTNGSLSMPKTFLAVVLSTITFFLLTNFGTWLMYDMYPKTAAGLVACLAAGIPFIKNSFLGDLFYVTVLFGSFELVKNYVPGFRVALVESRA